ncbi:MAG: hypothetical protein ABIH78_04545 [Candidatus Peregrinibacteria bacterium]
MSRNIIKTRYLKIGFALICLMFMSISGTFAKTANAQDDKTNIDPYVDGNLSIARCIAKGNTDFILFLSASSFSDGFIEGIFEPWYDVITRNQCQSADVLGLIKQRDKIRRYIRDAFLTCNNQKLPSLEATYYNVSAEIYYVRHVVEGDIVVSLPYNILSTRMMEDEESLYYPRDLLYNEMLDRYVNDGSMTKSAFDDLFRKLEFKYKERKKSYVICENDSWEQVAEKWNEFLNTVGGITPAWKNLEKGVGGRAEKIVEAATDMGIEDYLKGLVQVNLNNMGLKPGFEEISQNIGNYLPNVDIPTQEALLNAIELSEKEFNTELERQILMSEFEVMYRDISDSSVELITRELDALNQVILNSSDPLSSLLDCVEGINDRQCPM